MTEKSKKEPWSGGAFFVRLARVDEENPKDPVIEIPLATAQLLHRLHAKITPAIRDLQLLLGEPQLIGKPGQRGESAVEQEWKINTVLRHRLAVRDAKTQQNLLADVPQAILEKELEDRAREARKLLKEAP